MFESKFVWETSPASTSTTPTSVIRWRSLRTSLPRLICSIETLPATSPVYRVYTFLLLLCILYNFHTSCFSSVCFPPWTSSSKNTVVWDSTPLQRRPQHAFSFFPLYLDRLTIIMNFSVLAVWCINPVDHAPLHTLTVFRSLVLFHVSFPISFHFVPHTLLHIAVTSSAQSRWSTRRRLQRHSLHILLFL